MRIAARRRGGLLSSVTVTINDRDALVLAEVLSYASSADLAPDAQRAFQRLAAAVEVLNSDARTFCEGGSAYDRERRALLGEDAK